MKLFKEFLLEEEGLGTIEIVLLVAILVSIALIFKTEITKFVTALMEKFFDPDNIEIPYEE